MKNKRPETPYPRHWFPYMVLKFAIVALAIWLAFASQGMV